MTNLLHKISHLNIDRTKGAAPHKSLLLLCLLGIAAEGGLTEEVMHVTGELAFRFASSPVGGGPAAAKPAGDQAAPVPYEILRLLAAAGRRAERHEVPRSAGLGKYRDTIPIST